MNTIIEQVLQLPKEEKLELYFALQEDLDNELEQDELTKEQWEQLNEISQQLEDGSIKKISEEEMMDFLKKRKHGLSSNV